MAFDSTTRNRLAHFVADARGLIAEEFTQQFQSLYGISPKGDCTPLEKLPHLDEMQLATAALLRERIQYLIKSHPDDKGGAQAAVERLAREQAFTVLNRFAAIRMAEKRGIIVESIGKSYQSKGFKVYETVAGSGLGEAYHRYQRYLFCLFDELAVDLGVLFDRRSPHALLFPREQALLALLELINDPEIEPLWAEDETVGWIYQYYNDPLERKKMREQSAAPRNSRELAVRNQFFTPRYVVEFLTDNTLGRIWYEMTKGRTKLKEQCRYLVRRPTEVFLGPEEGAPEVSSKEASENLSQEELLRQTVFIPHRPLKDPRAILMLDPACGSMHFGLYAFDLFEVIYEEFWDLTTENTESAEHSFSSSSPSSVSSVHSVVNTPLRSLYTTKEEFLRDVPRLIIENNLHGIDIDPRCAQIAGLSLWLRAQKAWQRLGLAPAERPAIKRSNIVCAEPMPGKKELLREFVEREFPAAERTVCLRLLEAIFDKMQLAGEAGSLLKIEEEIRSAIDDAKKQWKAGPQMEQSQLFGGEKLKQQNIPLDYSGLTESEFWDQLEEKIYAALRDYAEQAENGGGFQRRLFAEDAARGFAFIDVCRKRYDVVLMNPPFGECSPAIKTYLSKIYKDNAVELYCAFTDRDLNLLHPDGLIGCITSSSFVLYTDFTNYRDLLLQQQCLEHLANLGDSVLDGAYVYTASYIIRKAPPAKLIAFYDLRFEAAKAETLEELVRGTVRSGMRLLPPQRFAALASSPLCHWASDSLFSLAESAPSLETILEDAGVGAAPQADFFNLWWEVPTHLIGLSQRWVRISNGGAFSPYHRADYLVVDWQDNGKRAVADLNHRYPYLNGNVGIRIQRTHLFGKPGITYGKRTDRFNAQVLPADQMFTFEGIAVFPDSKNEDFMLGLLAYLNSRFVAYYLNLTAGLHKNDVYICRLPFPLSEQEVTRLGQIVRRVLRFVAKAVAIEESHPLFSGAFLGVRPAMSIRRLAADFKQRDRINEAQYFEAISGIEDSVTRLCGLDAEMLSEVERDQGFDVFRSAQRTNHGSGASTTPERERPGFCRSGFEQSSDLFRYCINKGVPVSHAVRELNASNEVEEETVNWFANSILSYALGVALGRWDINYATGEQAAPELPDPFAPLPVCPPGQLQNAQGLPLGKEEVGRMKEEGNWNYPIEIPWDGILVDDPNHPLDLERRVREVIEIIWSGQDGGPTAEAIEHEACEILGVKSLRDYFRKPAGFFADHLKRYSKSRRQAPIYWPLSTASGSYTLWIYYHRLTDQTLHTALADFLEPKIRHVQAELDAHQAGGNGQKAGESRDFLDELKDLRDEIERIIKLPWKPNLNDGVLITASPLWKLFRLSKWQKDLKACWDDLEAGEYDWAHLAHSIWPQRVEKACERDRSIAIAHGLEHLCKVEPPKPKKKRAKKAAEDESKDGEPKLI